jgi:hypothetical protein
MSTPQLNCPIIADYLDNKRLFSIFGERKPNKQKQNQKQTPPPPSNEIKKKTSYINVCLDNLLRKDWYIRTLSPAVL